MKEIKLTRGLVAIVDDDMFHELNSVRWSVSWNKKGVPRIHRRIPLPGDNSHRPTELMSRVVMGAGPGQYVGHLHHNTLDMRREMLYVSDCRGVHSNLKGKQSGEFTSQHLGVYWCNDRKKWRACIDKNNKTANLGTFTSEEMAAAAYQLALESL